MTQNVKLCVILRTMLNDKQGHDKTIKIFLFHKGALAGNSFYPIVKSESVKVTLCNPMDSSMEFSGPEYWSGNLFLLQGIFPTQGSNPGLPHCRHILYQLSPKGSPSILEWLLMSIVA